MSLTDVPRAMGEQALTGNAGRRSVMQFISDSWAALGYKKVMEARDDRIIPSWVGSHWRRLTAYKLLTAIYQNRARAFLAIDDEDVKAKHREYGDAALIVDTVRSAVTGDDVSIVIPGMDGKDEDAQKMLEWLEQWGQDERLPAKVLETELDAGKLGDGVYVITADVEKERPRLRLFDAGFYFPELDPNHPEDEFPKRVHVAWEYEEDHGDGTTTRWIRRMTWELGPITPIAEGGLFSSEVLRLGDRRDLTGSLTRKYAWNDKPSRVTCYFTDGHWNLHDLPQYATMDNPVAWGQAQKYEVGDDGLPVVSIDLQKDYIPVIHLPNSVAIKEHYGESVLLRIAQALDELAAADTDAASAAKLAGTPMLAASGTTATDMKVEAGTVIGLQAGGRMDALDLSKSLEAIMAYCDKLQDRIVVNARLTNEAMGRVQAANIKSGLHLALSFGPMRSMVEALRLVRNEKYPILLRFVQREALAQGWITGPIQPATLAFGSFLPSDKAAVVELAKSLFEAHLISRETAIQMLVDEGVIEVDVAEELKACQREDFESALALFEALGGGDDAADQVWELLGKMRPEPSNTVEGSNTPPSNTTGVQMDPETGAPILDLRSPFEV
jgi:hypothetical protein